MTAIAALVAVLAVLAARPLLHASTASLVVLFTAVLTVGLSLPAWGTRPDADNGQDRRRRGVIVALTIGIAAFVAGRALGGASPARVTTGFVGLNVFAAVAEEAFFRRALYGALLARGAVVAVVGSSALFALVHVATYGWWVAPVDFAAGLVLAWQRRASGSWVVPAFTHAVANVVALW